MGRAKGTKNRRTLVREAEEMIGKSTVNLDSLHVMEVAMHHFYTKAMVLKQKKVVGEEVDTALQSAAAIAEKLAPYRHPRLNAVKLTENTQARFNEAASADELRAEVMRRLGILAEAGVIDLEALPSPSSGPVDTILEEEGGIANQPVPIETDETKH